MRPIGWCALVWLAACCPPPVTPTAMPSTDTPSVPAAAARTSAVSPERIGAFPPPGWQVPRLVQSSPDGALITYLQSAPAAAAAGGAAPPSAHGEEMALWAYDTKSRERRVLLRAADLPAQGTRSHDEEMRRERQRTRIEGITSYAWAARANVLLIPAGERMFVRDAAGAIQPVAGDQALDPKLSPDGSKVAFARGRELWLSEVGAAGKARALTKDAREGIKRGQSDFISQEELAEPSGIWWSPAGDRLAFLEVDERGVGDVPILGFRDGARFERIPYPRTGGKNPVVRLAVSDLAGRVTWIEMPAAPGFDAADQYLGRLAWSPDGAALFFQRLSRDQQHLMLVRADARTGKARALLDHGDPTWEVMTQIRALDDKRVVVAWPRGGHVHLAVIDAASGEVVKQLTDGDWDVFQLVGVDVAGRVLFIANKDAVLDRQLYAVHPESGAIARLSPESGVHDVQGEHFEGGWVDIHSANDRLPQATLRDAAGNSVGAIEVPRDADFDKLGIRNAELVTVPQAGDAPELYGALLTPRDMQAGERYPAVVVVYGGPGVQAVLNEYNARLLWQALADRGFVVFQVDNRGALGRGHGFDAPVHHRLGEVELADQLRGLDWLAAQPFVDAARLGIYGHSYGGYMALTAMLRAPGRFKVGVAGSPVTDWSFYDTGYTERYMGTPASNAAGYRDTALAPVAKNLTGKLLVIHALMDENVHFEHTAALVDALVAADKDFDLMVFPGERHGYRSPEARKYAYRRIVDYFVKNL